MPDCFSSLKKAKKGDNEVELILVDNASPDDTVEYMKKNYPNIRILKSKKNLGFAGGNNIGIKWALENGFE